MTEPYGSTAIRGLIFAPGVVLQKRTPYVQVLANRGLFSGTWNTKITVEGATIDVNQCSAGHDENSPMFGNRGQVSFCRIRNLMVRNFNCLNLHGPQYGFQIAAFENVVLDGFEIRGAKDGIHVNAGRKFVIRNGTLETGDDGPRAYRRRLGFIGACGRRYRGRTD